ncbi:membrane-bound lytic murein transglycosylase F [Muriicola jejuensis]|uniref:Transporter substrate-binding domain-containing protein n=1 Tax=Muriicola jejuensis TaxID=504488 RepID=A0A6P0UBS6_9FLAO|nr:transporter substrate-binding domain-containing protein [Muriicola jejuensis]NER10062.1 transporter substrate-binding domain-containing protein [Muriicola jejuensis]SMP03288.1 membrane-bound lytic murein transglycosylase F [Muriicola jejuensis]
MSNFKKYLLLFCLLLISCEGFRQNREKRMAELAAGRDLTEIQADGKLRALIAYSATSYFLYRGQPMGYEYELLKRLADDLGVELELHVSRDLDEMLNELKKGTVDIVAHGLAITAERKQEVAFSEFLYITEQVLVQRKPEGWRQMTRDQIKEAMISDPIELIGDTVSVRKNSSYFKRIRNLSREIGGEIVIDTLRGNITTDEIIKMVADGEIKYTLADKNLASINASYYPDLDVEVPLSFSQRIAWALRPGSKDLLKATNLWIQKEKKQDDYYVIYNKYFKNKRNFRRRVNSPFYSLNQKQISRFDPIIKENSRKLGWDWRLLASLIYQESRFDPEAQSWSGAKGLMQLMPDTAEELGVTATADAGEVIRAGTHYLGQLYENFSHIADSVQRIKFTLASYNCGYSHVLDAQNLAQVKGLKDTVWDGNVAEMILALSFPQNYNHEVVKFGYVRGLEPFQYVEQIFQRYDHYRKFIDREEPENLSLAGS